MTLRKWFFLLSTAVLLAGCTANPATTIFNTNSSIAAQKAQLFDVLFWMGVVVFLLVVGILILAILRGRRKPGDTAEPYQNHGHVRLGNIWTVVPLLLVAYIFFYPRTNHEMCGPRRPRKKGI